MMKILLVSFLLLSSSSIFAQSAASKKGPTNQQLQASILDVEANVSAMQKDLKKVSKLLDNKAMLGLFQRLDEVSQDVSELRGMVEEQGHLQQRLQKRQRELYLDLDRRLREMELNITAQPKVDNNPIPVPDIPAVVVDPAITVETPTPTVQNNQEVTAKPEVIAPVEQAKTEPKVTPKEIKKPVISQPTQPMSKERKEYQKSFDLLKEGRYKKAKTAFKGFLDKYPDSSYAGNAQYWSGEANYVTRQFATAMKEFKRVITQYPASNKVPDAMLKLGYTFYETRQMDSAKQILNELVKRFPKATAARLAAKRLKRMKREGF